MNLEHLEILKKGVDAWNQWRKENPSIRPDLNGIKLFGANLSGVNLNGASLGSSKLFGVHFLGADLRNAYLSDTNLRGANLRGANLQEANLGGAYLYNADLGEACLYKTHLRGASLIKANIENAVLSNSNVYGISIWDLRGKPREQKDMIITDHDQPKVTVDNIKFAQFIYLLLENEEIRDAIDTLTSKAVLILGRFSEGRKKILDSLKDHLRDKNYLPILFDFEKPISRDLLETVKTLVSLSRFVVADITDARSVLQELSSIVPHFPSIPVKLIIEESQQEYGMFDNFRRYPWVLDTYKYPSEEVLLANLEKEIIFPAEQKVSELKLKE